MDIKLQKYKNSQLKTPDCKEPMLSNKFYSATIDNHKKTNLKFPVLIKPRWSKTKCLMYYNNEYCKYVYITRNSKEITEFPSIFDEEMSIFYRYLPDSCVIDGEITNNLTKKNDTTFLITDIRLPDKIPIELRYKILIEAYTRYADDNNVNTKFYIINSVFCYSLEEINNYYNEYLKAGFDTIMIRNFGSMYTSGRTNNLLKYKGNQN
jgi:hypothetical protein